MIKEIIKKNIKKIPQKLRNIKSNIIFKAEEEVISAKKRLNRSILRGKEKVDFISKAKEEIISAKKRLNRSNVRDKQKNNFISKAKEEIISVKNRLSRSILKGKKNNYETNQTKKIRNINASENYNISDVFKSSYTNNKTDQISKLQNVNKLESSNVADKLFDKNEFFKSSEFNNNNELEVSMIPGTFNEGIDNNELFEIKKVQNINASESSIISDAFSEDFVNNEPYEIKKEQISNELEDSIISDTINKKIDVNETYEISKEENTNELENNIIADAFETIDKNKSYELNIIKNTFKEEDSMISDAFNESFDEHKSYEVNKLKNINDLEDSDVSDHFNEVFDLNSHNSDKDQNIIDNTLNEDKINNENNFFKVLSYVNPSTLFLTLIISVFVGSGFWATFTELDEVIRCSGQVVPVSNAKVVQSEFQGKVSSINFKVGDNVKSGDVLLTLKDSDFVTEININKEDYFSSLALIQRLEGESNFVKPIFSLGLTKQRPDLMNAQLQIYNARINTLKNNEKLLKNELEKLIYNIEEVKADIQSSTSERKFLDEELKILSPLVKKGFEPRLKLVQISQRLAALDSRILKSRVAIPGIKIDIRKITQKLKNLKNEFISKAKEEIISAKDRFNKSVLKSSQLNERLRGTEIHAPVNGLISKVEISTIGAIVSSGTNLFEIIPTSDELIIEAEVRPEDIAFVRFGQKARISVTAYDPSVYGFLDGEVQNIAGNTTERPDGSKYFSARIITKSKMFDKKKDLKLEIIPGMEASVELQGDKRSVLDYILTPIKKLQRESFTEK